MTYWLGLALYVLMFIVPALTLWAFVFRFLPFCCKAYRAVKADERAHRRGKERETR